MRSWEKNGRRLVGQVSLPGLDASEWMVKGREEDIRDDRLEGIGNGRT